MKERVSAAGPFARVCAPRCGRLRPGEPAFRPVGPGGRGRREANATARAPRRPGPDRSGLAGDVVVHDDTDVQIAGGMGVGFLEEIGELPCRRPEVTGLGISGKGRESAVGVRGRRPEITGFRVGRRRGNGGKFGGFGRANGAENGEASAVQRACSGYAAGGLPGRRSGSRALTGRRRAGRGCGRKAWVRRHRRRAEAWPRLPACRRDH